MNFVRLRKNIMVVPFLALIAVIVLVAVFLGKNAKNKDKGNKPNASA